MSSLYGRPIERYNGGAYFFLKDPQTMERTLYRLQQNTNLPWDSLKLYSNQKTFQDAAAPLERTENICIIILPGLIIISIALLSLVLTLWQRERLHEIGILISLGIGKFCLFLQFLFENILVVILAFVISGIISNLAGGTISSIIQAGIQGQYESGASVELAVTIGWQDMLTVFIVGIFLIALSVLIASAIIFRLKPRELLSWKTD